KKQGLRIIENQKLRSIYNQIIVVSFENKIIANQKLWSIYNGRGAQPCARTIAHSKNFMLLQFYTPHDCRRSEIIV
ncbi:MAG: hypothetical protein AAFO08_02815, partial [Pseudomonadota bacterium]